MSEVSDQIWRKSLFHHPDNQPFDFSLNLIYNT